MLFTTRQKYISWKCNSGQKDCSQNFIQIVPSDSKPPEINNQLIPNIRRANPIKHYRKQLMPTSGSGSRGANISHINRPGGSVLLHKDKKCCGNECQCDKSVSNISFNFTIGGGFIFVSPDIHVLCSNKLINITGSIPEQELIYITNTLPPDTILNDNLDSYMKLNSFITNLYTGKKYLQEAPSNNGSFILPCNYLGPYYLHGAKQITPPNGIWNFRTEPYIEFTICCSSPSTSIQTYLPLEQEVLAGKHINDCDCNSVCVPGCNPESRVIKSSITILNQNYYTGTHAYLQSRCKTFKQKSITLKNKPEVEYINSSGKAKQPTNSPTGSQVFKPGDCRCSCSDISCVCFIPCSNTTIYKPNNSPFTQQGAVSGSTRIAKLKYDTVTKNGNSFISAFGAQEANTGKYRLNDGASYFVKTKKLPYCLGIGCQNSQCTRHRSGNRTLCFSMTK